MSIQFEAKPHTIGSWIIVRLPEEASAKLPSRGMVMVEGTLNGLPFQAALEPDGQGSHWFRLDKMDPVAVSMEPMKVWPEPRIPEDLESALESHPQAGALWSEITTMARWDWIRWIGSTNNGETRKKRIGVALSKLNAGDRRPCCFNRSICAEPAVSKNGILK